MSKENEFPYPTHFEIIRYFVGLLDLKMSSKKLDDLAAKTIFHPKEVEEAIQGFVTDTVTQKVGHDTAAIVTEWVTKSVKSYSQLVSSHNADGISRGDMTPLLLSCFVKDCVADLVIELHQHYGGPQPVTLFSSETNAVDTTINWFEHNEINWTHYIDSLEKEQRDQISLWKKGVNLPSAQYIHLLQVNYKGPWPESINWQRVRTWLFIARAIDTLRKKEEASLLVTDVRLLLWSVGNTVNFADEINKLQRNVTDSIENNVLSSIAVLQHDLRRTVIKPKPSSFLHHFDVVKKYLSANQTQTTGHWIDWHEARWYVFKGDLDRANELYRLAFEGALFRSGENLKAIIEEAIVVAASLKKPDKVFLKHLKWAQINFGYDIPSVNNDESSNKFEDSVEEWEINLWKSSLATVFPEQGLFEGVSLAQEQKRVGPLVVSPDIKITPDFRYPSRKIKVGETWQKIMPQLQWFMMIEDFETVNKLIKEGADINGVSDANDSALIYALKIMNVLDTPFQSLDKRFFELISEQKHKAEIVNGRTIKKRLLPIILAVQTGKLEIVQKVLKMGADPNRRGETDLQTALNVCIKLIGMVTKPESFLKNQNLIPTTEIVLDAIRRENAGLSGFTLEQQERHVRRLKNDPRFKQIQTEIQEQLAERVQKLLDIQTMREIAGTLINAGADVNATHVSPLDGYTPLMLAAELDEVVLFEKMLIRGGRPEQSFVDSVCGQEKDCWIIADQFGSKQVKKVLSDIYQYYPRNSLH